jgi:hypothetical protein
MKQKKSCTWTIINIYYKICKRIVQKFIYEKVIFVQKDMQSYSK